LAGYGQMIIAEEYREFSADCLRRATEVRTEEERQVFLDMALDWLMAALRLERTGILDDKLAFPATQPPRAREKCN
jgi:hypothetical protein